MKASALEFRFRYLIHTVIFVAGFVAPWNFFLHLDPAGANAHVWGLLSAMLAKYGVASIGTAFDLVLIAGIVCASSGALLRTWGSAYLGADIVQDGAMHTAGSASGIVADGPYRRLRNPLYLGTFVFTLALVLLMPRTGAIWTVVLIGLVQIRLILGEEAFLYQKLGAPYAAYCALVPRIVPALRPRVPASGRLARWPQAFLGETYMWLVAVSFAVAGWRYNAILLIQCAVVAFGISLVARAFLPKPKTS